MLRQINVKSVLNKTKKETLGFLMTTLLIYTAVVLLIASTAT